MDSRYSKCQAAVETELLGTAEPGLQARSTSAVTETLACVGSDIHEEASVKTGARRARNFPDIHSASSVVTERHE
jgi:hypothetical protein